MAKSLFGLLQHAKQTLPKDTTQTLQSMTIEDGMPLFTAEEKASLENSGKEFVLLAAWACYGGNKKAWERVISVAFSAEPDAEISPDDIYSAMLIIGAQEEDVSIVPTPGTEQAEKSFVDYVLLTLLKDLEPAQLDSIFKDKLDAITEKLPINANVLYNAWLYRIADYDLDYALQQIQQRADDKFAAFIAILVEKFVLKLIDADKLEAADDLWDEIADIRPYCPLNPQSEPKIFFSVSKALSEAFLSKGDYAKARYHALEKDTMLALANKMLEVNIEPEQLHRLFVSGTPEKKDKDADGKDRDTIPCLQHYRDDADVIAVAKKAMAYLSDKGKVTLRNDVKACFPKTEPSFANRAAEFFGDDKADTRRSDNGQTAATGPAAAAAPDSPTTSRKTM